MSGGDRESATYRMARAREALAEARLLLERGHVNTYVSRLYYACYYAVSALLVTRGLSASRHSGVRALLHQEFVKPGLLPQEMGRHFDRLFDNRQKADYADFVTYPAEDVAGWLPETQAFLDGVEELLDTPPEQPA